MVRCERCTHSYDRGEVIGGICVDCREKEKQEQLRASTVIKIMNSPSYQMELNLEVMSNG